MSKYSFSLIWSEDDQGYIATVPEFPNLSAFGETQKEALQEAQIVLNGFIEEFQESDEKLPEANTISKYSGQTRLRMPKSLHAQLVKDAQEDNHSLNSHIVYLLTERRLLNVIDKFKEKFESLDYWQEEVPIQFDLSLEKQGINFFNETESSTKRLNN